MFAKTKTVDGILNTFKAMIADLTEVEQLNKARQENLAKDIEALEIQQTDAIIEATRAAEARVRITALLG